ncbi:MAG: Gfo/Idh/MocA family protein [Fimbriimonas sp.]
MNRKVRIGFVGVGNMGQAAHLRHYVQLPDCEVVAIAEPRVSLAREVANRYGVNGIYHDADEMLRRERLDGLVAIQPFERHGSIVQPLYKHGLPLLTEKPLASSVETGEAMISALRAGGSWHMVGYHKRNDPAVVWARQQIGALGSMRYIRITMPPGDWIAGGFDDLVRSDEQPPHIPADEMPSGLNKAEYLAFVNYYIHQVNLLRYLLGEPYQVTFADKSSRLLVAETPSGVTGTIEMAPFETAIGWHESVLIGFDKAAIGINLLAPLADHSGSAEILRSDGSVERADIIRDPAMKMQAANFIAAIRGEAKPACEAAEALQDLRIARDWLQLKTSRDRAS